MLRRFCRYYRPYKGLFILDMICAFLIAICDLVYPMITSKMMDEFVPNRELRLLLTWAIALLVIYLIKAALNYIVQYYGHTVGVGIQGDLRHDMFAHLQDLPFHYFDKHKTGVIMSRIITDMQEISEMAHHGPEDFFISGIMLIGTFIILCTINIPLTLIVFIFVPVLIFFAMRMRLKLQERFAASRRQTGYLNAEIENSISGIRVSKAYVTDEYEIDKFEENNQRLRNIRKSMHKVMGQYNSGTQLITDLLNGITLLSAGLFVFFGQISYGEFVAYLLYVGMFLTPVRKLTQFMEMYQQGMTGFKRFVELMDAEPEKDKPGAQEIETVNGDIEFRDVTFGYEEGRSVLEHISLHIPRGHTVALVGPSGGGKTTLCHLLPRFYEPTSGEILIDGVNIEDITMHSLRRQIGIVQQDVFLFTGTVRDNIAYGSSDATEEEIVEAAKKANIHDAILSLPHGYNTYIGERGIMLSGGQKQRISIARIFLKNPKILILDEATSALDNATELLIQKALEDLCKGRTTLIVAHRLSTIKNADEIIVLTDNGIQQRGTHAQLLAQDGLYRELYSAQFSSKGDNETLIG